MRDSWPKLLVVVLALIAFGLGVHGYRELPPPPQNPFSWSDAIYRSLQLFVFNREDPAGTLPWTIEVARFLAPATTVATATLVFLARLVAAGRLLRYRWFGNHLVVCGLGRKGVALARDAIANQQSVVAIERAADSAGVAAVRALGVPVVLGDAADRAILEQAGVTKARALFVSCGADDDNIRVTLRALEAGKARNRKSMRITPHILDAEVRDQLRSGLVRITGDTGGAFRLHEYSHYELAARALFQAHPLDHQPIGIDSPRHAHLVLIGFGRMGQAVFRQALKIGHYPNDQLLRVSVFDAHADRLWKHFLGRFPNFASTTLPKIAEIERHAGNVIDLAQMAAIDKVCQDAMADVTIAICLDCEAESVMVAKHLPMTVATRKIPVLVRIHEAGGISDLIIDHRQRTEPGEVTRLNLYAFGQVESTATLAEVLRPGRDQIAQAIHESYRLRSPSVTTRSQLPWYQLDEVFRDSNRQAADFMPVLLRSFGMELVPIAAVGKRQVVTELSAEQLQPMGKTEHARWYAERYLAGWHPAEARDDATKAHDCMVRWDQLEPHQRQKDFDQVNHYIKLASKQGEIPPLRVVRSIDSV